MFDKQLFDEDGTLIEFMEKEEALYYIASNYVMDPRPADERDYMWSVFAKGVYADIIQVTKDGRFAVPQLENPDVIEFYRVREEEVFGDDE